METVSRVALDGFGVEHRAGDLQDGRRRVVFCGNQVDGLLQPLFFTGNESGQFGIVMEEVLHGRYAGVEG